MREKYGFNYRLKADSPAIGKGNPDFITPIDLFDTDCAYRLVAGAPALGAYAR